MPQTIFDLNWYYLTLLPAALRYLCRILYNVMSKITSQLSVSHEAKWPSLMEQARWGFTRHPSSQLCRGILHPVTPSWEGPWRTWYRPAHSFVRFITWSYYLHLLSSGCTSGENVLPLGVPGPAGLHHVGDACGPDSGPDRCSNPGCPAGYRLVQSQLEQGAEPHLGWGWVWLKHVERLNLNLMHFKPINIKWKCTVYVMTNVCYCRWRGLIWFLVNLSEQDCSFFLHGEVGLLISICPSHILNNLFFFKITLFSIKTFIIHFFYGSFA